AFTIAATGSLDDDRAGLAAGLLNTATQLGGGFGLGIIASLLAGAAGPTGTASLRIGFLVCIAFSAAALLLATRLTGAATPARNTIAVD
ncbi:MAG TPA: hypothetical protein VH502_08375, partial [Actinoplanes sp.]